MKKFLLATLAVSGLSLCTLVAKAADKEAGSTWKGVLIDNKCGEGKDEAAAGKHSAACSAKDACAKSGYSLVVGDKHYKLDEKLDGDAQKYLKGAKDNKVTIEGKMDGDKITEISSIKEATK